jgi:hypothetical protein
MPQQVGRLRPTPIRGHQPLGHDLELVGPLERRVDQHQTPSARGRQQGGQRLPAIAVMEVRAAVAADRPPQHGVILVVGLDQQQRVVGAQGGLGQHR